MGTLSQTTARLLSRLGQATPPRIGAARPADLDTIDALLAPHVAAGTMLPRSADADAFLVARRGGRVVGAVALTAWTDSVAELGSLVVAQRGLGLGARLVQAAEERAAQGGFGRVVALTSSPAFFVRCGWTASAHSPGLRARAWLRGAPPAALSDALSDAVSDSLSVALDAKASRCATCPRLASCSQVMLVRAVARAEAA